MSVVSRFIRKSLLNRFCDESVNEVSGSYLYLFSEDCWTVSLLYVHQLPEVVWKKSHTPQCLTALDLDCLPNPGRGIERGTRHLTNTLSIPKDDSRKP